MSDVQNRTHDTDGDDVFEHAQRLQSVTYPADKAIYTLRGQ